MFLLCVGTETDLCIFYHRGVQNFLVTRENFLYSRTFTEMNWKIYF